MSDLRVALERPALRRLWGAARKKIETLGRLGGTVRLDQLDSMERTAIADLLGLRMLPPADQPWRIPLERLDRALRASPLQCSLEDFLTELGGPLRDLPAERRELEEDWQSVFPIETPPDLFAPEAFAAEQDAWRADGTLRRLARGAGPEVGRELLQKVVAVLRRLPAPEMRLAVLASETLGDSHALDNGHRVPALVLRVIARHARLTDAGPPQNAHQRRELWALAGVECDDLSCDVLVHALAPLGDALLQRTLRAFAAEGEPLRLTLRQLMGAPAVVLSGKPRVFVCENPAIVALAAQRLGSACPPMVCLAGNPSTAALRLLRPLVDAGSELMYHGDFDWGGLRIANTLGRSVAWTPWRFSAADYRTMAGRSDLPSLPTLEGQAVDAFWDPALRPALEELKVVVEEEAMAEELLADLHAAAIR